VPAGDAVTTEGAAADTPPAAAPTAAAPPPPAHAGPAAGDATLSTAAPAHGPADAGPAPAPAPAAHAAPAPAEPAHAATAGPAHGPADAGPAPAAGAPAAPTAPARPEAAPAQAAPLPPPVRLTELAHAARTAIAVTARRGGTVARIVLHPRELGTVEIRLSYRADGISATVRADSAQAAQALAQAGGDLRQALAEHGLDLLDLDIRDRRGEADGQTFTSQSRRAERQEDVAAADEHEVAVDPVRLAASSSRVDVLA
jgi:flagellar hook-length control protein FliK